MNHLNNDVLCVVKCRTTGPTPGFHDLIEIALLPLNFKLEPSATEYPFSTYIRPKHPERADAKVMKDNRLKIPYVIVNGLDPFQAADALDDWFNLFQLKYGKKIQVLAYDWAIDRPFILEWLGLRSFDRLFGDHVRDIATVALYENDCADIENRRHPYPKLNIQYLSNQLNVSKRLSHQALAYGQLTAEIYRRMVYKRS